MDAVIEEFLAARPVAIVGASADRRKYGNIILRHLRERGWDVLAVNPKAAAIEGQPAYATLADCPRRPALAMVMTPPPATWNVLEQARAAGVERLWLQDGSWTPALLERAAALRLRVVRDACILVMAARAH